MPPAPTVVLAHGAGAGCAHPWMRHVSAGMEQRGCRVETFDFPYIAEGRKIPDKAPVLEAAFERAWQQASTTATGPMFAAGKSMGGRMASMVAARKGFAPNVAGLIFFGYPLHPPNRPAQRRDGHLPQIAAPMLFLHGTRDPFGTPEEMQELVAGLPSARLHLVDKGDHSLISRRGHPLSADVLDLVLEWIQRVSGVPVAGSAGL